MFYFPSKYNRRPNGITFEVKNPADNSSLQEIKKGDVVTFTHLQHSRLSVPVSPSIYRIRKDVDWRDVVHNFYNNSKVEYNFAGIAFYYIIFYYIFIFYYSFIGMQF